MFEKMREGVGGGTPLGLSKGLSHLIHHSLTTHPSHLTTLPFSFLRPKYKALYGKPYSFSEEKVSKFGEKGIKMGE